MTDADGWITPDHILPPEPISASYNRVEPTRVYYPVVLHKQGREMIRVHHDMRVELVEGATIREALAALVQAASIGMAPEGVPEALADAIIRMAREDDRE